MLAYGGFLTIAAHLLYLLLPFEIPIELIAIVTLGLILLLLCKGSYERLEHVIIGMMILLFIGILFSLFALNLPLSEIADGRPCSLS